MLLVETCGDYQMMDFTSGEIARHDRASVVPSSDFFQVQIELRKLRMLAELADTATDADWVETLKSSDNDAALAIEAFKSMHPVAGAEPAPAPKKSTFVNARKTEK